MKCSTTMAIAFCGILAVAMTGCKYDDDEMVNDPNANVVASDLATEVDPDAAGAAAAGADVNTQADDSALMNADSVDLNAATGVPFDQDPNFARCADVDFTPVYFGFDASNLAQSEMAKIEVVAQHLNSNPDRVVMVEGNCDERGSNEYNLSLGDLRAVAIRDYLLTLGVAADRVQTKSYGEEKPAVFGSGESVWSKNRRGEFAVYKHK